MKKNLLSLFIAVAGLTTTYGQGNGNNPFNPYEQFEGKTKVYVPGENKTYIMDDVRTELINQDKTAFMFENVIATVNGKYLGNGNGAQEIIIRRRESREDIFNAQGEKVGVTCAAGGGLCVILVTAKDNDEL